MITIDFMEGNRQPIYEQLYLHIRSDIESGNIKAREKLPSKRKLSAHLQISQSTVENAYAQLIAEGYVESIEKKGYYVVRKVQRVNDSSPYISQRGKTPIEDIDEEKENKVRYDLKTNNVDTDNFPFSIWAKLSRECLRENGAFLLNHSHPQGNQGLRIEIATYLKSFRGIEITPDQIVLGAGTEYLLGLITELLPGSSFALEEPGYYKIAKILKSRGVPIKEITMDDEGMNLEQLEESAVDTAIITPSHHFPLGTVMSINRRMQLLQWADKREERYLIEDDYDSEYRFLLKPIPPLQSLDRADKVIYLNTFARTLAPSLRIAYMVLPKKLLIRYQEELLFYSCTVSEFEQQTLKMFLQRGYYERHLNRMRTIYKSRRDAFIKGLSDLPVDYCIKGQEAGLHLLVQVNNGMSERMLVEKALENGVKVYALSDYYLKNTVEKKVVVIGYGGFPEQKLLEAASLLVTAWS